MFMLSFFNDVFYYSKIWPKWVKKIVLFIFKEHDAINFTHRYNEKKYTRKYFLKYSSYFTY